MNIVILSGTNRPQSRSLHISKILQKIYQKQRQSVQIVNLEELPLHEALGAHFNDKNLLPQTIKEAVTTIDNSDGLVIVCPEYNGSFPGALKYFIDFWNYPTSFRNKPFALVGLGGQYGGLRPIEHLQGVLGHCKAFICPERVFLHNIRNGLNENNVLDEKMLQKLNKQSIVFTKFISACKASLA